MKKRILVLLIVFLISVFFSCINSSDEKEIIDLSQLPPPPPPKPGDCYDNNLKENSFSLDTIIKIKVLSKIAKRQITENDIYELITQTVFLSDEDALPDSLCLKIVKKVSTNSYDITFKDIENLYPKYISKNDIIYLYSQLTCDEFLWDCSKLKNTVCLSVADLVDLQKSYQDSCSYEDVYWDTFIRKYGYYGLHVFSKPIFNLKKDFALVIYNGSGGRGLGSGQYLIFKKESNKWILVEEITTWVT